MASYWRVVNDVIIKADVLLLVLDARQPYDTISKELVDKARLNKKPLIYVITKADLIDKSLAEPSQVKLSPVVFVSGKTGAGMSRLYKEIFSQAKAAGRGKGIVKVGVMGYPNVGKSSLINALKGKYVAKTSGLSSYTRAAQKVWADKRLMVIDTPGVIPTDRKNYMKSAMIGSLDFTHVKEPLEVVIGLMKKYPGKLEAFYEVENTGDFEECIAEIALKKKIVHRGGKPDLTRIARMVLADWHKGIIKI